MFRRKMQVVDPTMEVVDPTTEVVDPTMETVDPTTEVVDPTREVVDARLLEGSSRIFCGNKVSKVAVCISNEKKIKPLYRENGSSLRNNLRPFNFHVALSLSVSTWGTAIHKWDEPP